MEASPDLRLVECWPWQPVQLNSLVRCLLPVQCARSKPATDADEPLFKVAVVPLEASADDTGTATMRSRVTLPGFALVVSLNHTMGDGHTYYRLYGMLDANADVVKSPHGRAR